MTGSLARSTQLQYNSAFKLWFQYCESKSFDGYEADKNCVLSFLTEQFKSGASYGTLNSFRSAISLISKNKIGTDDDICRFLKGVFKARPSKPKYSFTWNVSAVLNYLETLFPLDKLSFTLLTYKTVMLLILCTAHRAQTIASIKLENIVTTANAVLIHITDNLKTSGPGRSQPLLTLPFFNDNKNCVATTLLKYIEVSKDLRNVSDRLFVSVRKPHKDVKTQTISRWVKAVMQESGIDSTVFTAHSTRHASTSQALSRGVDIDTIRRTAGWSSGSHVFSRFYNRPILVNDSHEVALSLLNHSN